MRARYSPSDQRQVGSTGVASRTGLGTEPGSMGEDGQLREHTSPQNTIKRKENITSAVEVENKQYDSIFEASTPRIGYYQKKRPNRTTPLHLAPKRWLASRFTCEFENKFGSRAHRARKEWVARWRVHGQNFPPTRSSEVSSESKAPTNLFNEFHNFFICISVIRL